MDHLDENTVVQFVEGLLPAERAAQVERHVAGCEACRWLLSAMGLSATDTTSGDEDVDTEVRVVPPVERLRAMLGRVLNDTYRLDGVLGIGGMGDVFVATHLHLDRRLALKLLSRAHCEDGEAYARFRQEALIASRLDHPNIVEVTDFNYTRQGVPFLVMELLEGQNLGQRLRRDGRLSDLDELGAILRQACSALQRAHDDGIIHRDLKPTNLFLCRSDAPLPTVKVLDFGISKILDSDSQITATRAVVGTPRYMAPEQATEGGKVDARSDVYALGAIIYEMLAGRAPFVGGAVPALLYRVVHEPPPPPSDAAPVPAPLEEVVLKALSKRPEQRQRSMLELWSELSLAIERSRRQAPAQPEVAAEIETAVLPAEVAAARQSARRYDRKTWMVVMVGAAVLISVALGALVALWPQPARTTQVEIGEAQPAVAATTADLGGPPPGAARAGDGAGHVRGPFARRSARRVADAGSSTAASPPPDTRTVLQAGERASEPRLASGTAEPRRRQLRPHHRTRRRARARRRRRARRQRPRHDRHPSGGARRASARPRRRAPAPASLSVQTKTADGHHIWANIYLDGRKVGQTALTIERVAAGAHTLEARREGYRRAHKRVTLRSSERRVVRFVLRPR